MPYGAYLVNLGSQDDGVQAKSYTAFVSELRRCEVRGVQACAVGSSVGRQGALWTVATDCELPCGAVCCFLLAAVVCADERCMPPGGVLHGLEPCGRICGAQSA